MKKALYFRRQLLAGSLIVFMGLPVLANTAQWNPVSSERLVKLPGNYVSKAVEQDFLASPLAADLLDVTSSISGQHQSLGELRQAIESAEGETLIELRHQYLEQKSAFLDLKERQQSIRRQELDTKRSVYRRLIDSVQREHARQQNPDLQTLVKQQQAARQRMQNALADVDATLDIILPEAKQSKYAKEYSSNLARLGELQQAIKHHVANAATTLDGREVTREEYVRQLIFDIEAEQALLDQEQEMIRLMARLVALDAQDFEQQLTLGAFDSDQQRLEGQPLAEAVDFFTNP